VRFFCPSDHKANAQNIDFFGGQGHKDAFKRVASKRHVFDFFANWYEFNQILLPMQAYDESRRRAQI
jgi:hypothetical protein